MSTHLKITSIRIERTTDGWSVVLRENGEDTSRQDFALERDAESWAEGQRILIGNFMTHSPIPSS